MLGEMSASVSFWLVVAGFVIAFVLAFGIGANDVANSFGTSVGSKVLTLKQACILATIFEILGSILIGAKVSGTIRKGILDPSVFENSEIELMLGYVSALVGCCVWLILATILNYPVSGTHSIVGATVGMAIVSRGIDVVKWKEIIKIVISWFLSPLLSGVVSLLMFLLIRKFILRAENPLTAGLKFLPFIYTVTIFINVGGVVESSPPLLGFNKIPFWGKLLIVSVVSALVYLSVWLIVVPYMKKKIERTLTTGPLEEIEEQKLPLQQLGGATVSTSGQPGHDDDEKHNISTQVDYVQLIMSRNEDASKLVDKAYSELEHHQLSQQKIPATATGVLNRMTSLDQSTNTVNAADTSRNEVVGSSGKRPLIRMRTITAPTSASKDPLDYGDVNLTLCGYLHTIHTPAMRQHLSRSQLSHRSTQVKDRQSITNSMSVHNPSSAGNLRNDNPLAKLFSHKSVDPSSTAAATVSLPDSNTHQGKEKANEKRGRFNLVPATVPTPATANDDLAVAPESDVAQSSPAIVPVEDSTHATHVVNNVEFELLDPRVAISGEDKYDRKSILDNDDEDVEHILDMPTKKEKKVPEVDQYAYVDPPAAAKLFSFLQVLTAVFGSFAHGGNDVSNAIGPLIGLYLIYQDGRISSTAATPEWILFYGGVGISMGLWVLGRRVIKTIGEDLTKITASSGFVIELASAMTVLGASILQIPVSTTHCKVGSVVFTGRVRSKESVDWSLFRNIIIAWIVTVPVTGSIAAVCQFLLTLVFKGRYYD